MAQQNLRRAEALAAAGLAAARTAAATCRVTILWQRTLRRRSQDVRFAVRHARWEPYVGNRM